MSPRGRGTEKSDRVRARTFCCPVCGHNYILRLRDETPIFLTFPAGGWPKALLDFTCGLRSNGEGRGDCRAAACESIVV